MEVGKIVGYRLTYAILEEVTEKGLERFRKELSALNRGFFELKYHAGYFTGGYNQLQVVFHLPFKALGDLHRSVEAVRKVTGYDKKVLIGYESYIMEE